jgi:hypothetical protein
MQFSRKRCRDIFQGLTSEGINMCWDSEDHVCSVTVTDHFDTDKSERIKTLNPATHSAGLRGTASTLPQAFIIHRDTLKKTDKTSTNHGHRMIS